MTILTADSTVTADSTLTLDGLFSGTDWPSGLPAPQFAAALNPVDQTIRTDMEVGSARVRRRTRARLDMLDVEWLLSDAQFGVFRSWIDNNINGGVSWFNMPVPVGAGKLTVKSCRFVGPFKAQVDEGWICKVTAKLEIR